MELINFKLWVLFATANGGVYSIFIKNCIFGEQNILVPFKLISNQLIFDQFQLL